MQEVIFREVWLTEDRRIKAIPVAENSKIPIMLKVMDVTISGSAHAYSYSEKTGDFLMNRDESPVENNTVTIIPDAGLFQPGDNKLQVHFFAANGKAITGEYSVVCVPDFSASGEIPEASEVIGLVERAELGAANAEQSARNAAQSKNDAVLAKQAAETAKSDAETAKTLAEEAVEGIEESVKNAADSAEKAKEEREKTEQIAIPIQTLLDDVAALKRALIGAEELADEVLEVLGLDDDA